MSLSAQYYLGSVDSPAQREKYTSQNITIPLKEEGEEVVIDAENDLPEDSSELCTLLTNEECKAEYWLLVAKAYANLGKYEEALNVVKQANESSFVSHDDPATQAALHNFVSWTYLSKLGTSDDADLLNSVNTEIAASLSLEPANESATLAQAVVTLASQHHKGKRTNFEKESRLLDSLLRKHHQNCYALLGKAKIFFYRESYIGALKIFQKVLMLNPLLLPDSRIGIGMCYWFLDRKDLASRAWQNSVLVHPDGNTEAKILTCLAKFDECFSSSLSDEQFQRRYKRAMEFTKATYSEEPDSQVIQIVLASFYFLKGDYTTVERICDSILSSVGATSFVRSDALFWKARCTFAKGSDIHKAQRLFSEAAKLNDSNILARVGYAQCLVVRGQFQDAIRVFEKVQDSRPQSLEVTYALGMLYAKSSRYRRQAVDYLEKYVKLAVDQKESISLGALFILSKLYEDSDISKALEYLQMAKNQEVAAGKTDEQISYALLNNIGALATLCDREATEDFEAALKTLREEKFGDADLQKASEITLRYNVARSKEATGKTEDVKDSMAMYEQILEDCPHYTSARIRWLLLSCVSEDKHIKNELDNLLAEEPDNLELRSFYGWYLKNYGRRHNLSSDTEKGRSVESELHRETLVKYTSHDLYALISLANVYCSLAREAKDPRKKEQYYVRSAQLYQKVLGLDPKDVYAAQGIAIIFAQKKETGLALEILRRVRECLNSKAVYLNLGHCLLDAKQYAKAIENYKLALDRFTDGKDAKLLNFLARAWLYRGLNEKNLESFKNSLEYENKAYELNPSVSYKYNISFVQYQAADFIRKQPASKKSVEDLQWCKEGLEAAIKSLEELTEDTEHGRPPYPAEDLKLRAEMASSLIKQLDKATEEQEAYRTEQSKRLEESRRKHEEEEKKKLEEKELLEEERRKTEKKLAAERSELEKQQAEWNQMRLEEAKDQKDDIDAEQDRDASVGKKGGKKKKGKKAKKESKEFVVSDEEDEEEPQLNDEEEEAEEKEEEKDEELFGEDEEEEDGKRKNDDESSEQKPKRRHTLRKGALPKEDDGEEVEEQEEKIDRKKTKIIDEEEEEDDDGLF
ncbi:DEKNAAC101417 [Brettanomyces naardenensis]|uniref:DEKNAAC101417 n=1 Tax=Brettanomyces naardenensis TaxID=13370 RepID=A0A448YI37_BRENA|nr:DEKNAAC101417 [Brettanomyces naardenensis]